MQKRLRREGREGQLVCKEYSVRYTERLVVWVAGSVLDTNLLWMFCLNKNAAWSNYQHKMLVALTRDIYLLKQNGDESRILKLHKEWEMHEISALYYYLMKLF